MIGKYLSKSKGGKSGNFSWISCSNQFHCGPLVQRLKVQWYSQKRLTASLVSLCSQSKKVLKIFFELSKTYYVTPRSLGPGFKLSAVPDIAESLVQIGVTRHVSVYYFFYFSYYNLKIKKLYSQGKRKSKNNNNFE